MADNHWNNPKIGDRVRFIGVPKGERKMGMGDPNNLLFTCTVCYIKIGMPSGPNGWQPEDFIHK